MVLFGSIFRRGMADGSKSGGKYLIYDKPQPGGEGGADALGRRSVCLRAVFTC